MLMVVLDYWGHIYSVAMLLNGSIIPLFLRNFVTEHICWYVWWIELYFSMSDTVQLQDEISPIWRFKCSKWALHVFAAQPKSFKQGMFSQLVLL